MRRCERGTLLVLLLLGSCCVWETKSFLHRRFAFTSRHEHFQQKPTFRPPLASRLNLSTEVIEEKTSSKATLTFRADINVNTEPSKAVSIDQLLEFFKNPDNRNLLVTAGGSRPVTELSLTDELLEEWKEAASTIGAITPDGGEGEFLLAAQTGGINFPGLTMVSKAILGSKLSVLPTSRIPKYQFVLIKDEQSIEGLPPVVWIYKQLTGFGNKNSESKTAALSLTNFSVEIDETKKEVKFTSSSTLEVRVSLPSLLLRVLPVSKEKAEEQGSAAIAKTVESDVKKGITKFKEAYDAWVSS